MRTIRLFYICTFAILSLSIANSYAQVDSPYLADSLYGTTITLKPKGSLYVLTQKQAQLVHNAAINNYYFSFIVDPTVCKTKKFSKPTEFIVSCFLKTKESIDYDVYGVLYKKVLYFVLPEDVVDNTLLNEKNQLIRAEYDRLLDNTSRLEKEYEAILSSKERDISEALSSLDFREANKESAIDSLYQVKLAERLDPMMERYNAWYESLSPSAKKAASIITIQKSNLTSPNSAGGCDYDFEFTNMSNKTIKYLFWYGNVYNAVGDKVACTIRNSYSFSGKDTGPYPEKAIGGGEWDCIIYNWSAKEMRLSKITINYMDGSSASLSAKDIANISDAPECAIFEHTYSSIKGSAKYQIEKEIKEERALWQLRQKYLNNIDETSLGTSDIKNYFKALREKKREIQEADGLLKAFESRNFITKK